MSFQYMDDCTEIKTICDIPISENRRALMVLNACSGAKACVIHAPKNETMNMHAIVIAPAYFFLLENCGMIIPAKQNIICMISIYETLSIITSSLWQNMLQNV